MLCVLAIGLVLSHKQVRPENHPTQSKALASKMLHSTDEPNQYSYIPCRFNYFDYIEWITKAKRNNHIPIDVYSICL